MRTPSIVICLGGLQLALIFSSIHRVVVEMRNTGPVSSNRQSTVRRAGSLTRKALFRMLQSLVGCRLADKDFDSFWLAYERRKSRLALSSWYEMNEIASNRAAELGCSAQIKPQFPKQSVTVGGASTDSAQVHAVEATNGAASW